MILILYHCSYLNLTTTVYTPINFRKAFQQRGTESGSLEASCATI